MTKINIKAATIKDIPVILTFIKALAEFEKLLHEVTATEEILRENLFGTHPKAEAIIAYIDDKPVGIALYFQNFSTSLGKPGLYIEDLYVIPEARSKGIGKKLLQYLAKLAIERNCGRVEWCVLNVNQRAIDFYRSIGAVPIDKWTIQRLTGDALAKLAGG